MTKISYTSVNEMLALLEERKFEEQNQILSPKIQRVPTFLRQNPNFAKYCSPKVISFGPIHHQNENLKLGQHYKIQWTSLYIEKYSKGTNQSTSEAFHFLHKNIQGNISELKMLFAEDVIESYINNDEELALMFCVDGCSLLHFMEYVDAQNPEALNIKLGLLMYIWRDILLLENQLPRRLLELLRNEKGANLEFLMLNFSSMGEAKRSKMTIVPLYMARPTHLLHYVRLLIADIADDDMENGKNARNQQDDDEHNQRAPPSPEEENGNEPNQRAPPPPEENGNEPNQRAPPPPQKYHWLTYKNIRDLKKAGIRVMANETDVLTNISFTSKWFSGELRLPPFCFNDVSPYFFHNVIAYEMCPDFHNNFECCSYFSFMDSLIDDAEDVKELRLAGVLQNFLGSDKELAKLFNEIGHNLPGNMFHQRSNDVVFYSKELNEIKLQIQKHCTNKWKTWWAELCSTYFNTPWSAITLLAALLALVLAFLQTWYTIHPKNN